jgi:3-hydroxyisobutyrate dehydrogenase-like beta-hydroxyacid dehydrogenase
MSDNAVSPTATPKKLAFIGLGVMGAPMAGHLVTAGHVVTVYNRSSDKAQTWLRAYPQGKIASTPADAAIDADVVFACVGNDDDVRSVSRGPQGAFQTMPAGSVFVDHSTASAELARELGAYARTLGLHFIDAPVSGGQIGAETGRLAIMCGADPEAFERAAPVMQHYARAVNRMGPVGNGQLTKMVNQICIAGLLEGLSEAIHFGEKAGLNMIQVLEVISQGAAQSWQMQNRGVTMVERKFDYGFAVEWMRKDLTICLEEAKRNGAPLPVTAQVQSFYDDVQAMGGARWDTSSLITRLRQLS